MQITSTKFRTALQSGQLIYTAKEVKQQALKRETKIRKCGVSSFDYDPQSTAGFDKIWYLDFSYKLFGNRTKLTNFLVAANTETGHITVLCIRGQKDQLTAGENPEQVKKLFLRNLRDSEKWETIRMSWPDNNTPRAEKIRSLKDMDEMITRLKARSLSDYEGELEQTFKSLKQKSKSEDDKNNALKVALTEAEQYLDDAHFNFLRELHQSVLNRQVLEWVDRIARIDNPDQWLPEASLDINNHILDAVEDARGYRHTALLQFVPFGSLFLDAPIWEQIDNGAAPLRALADHMNVKQSTLKHMAQSRDVFSLGTSTGSRAKLLDNFDIAHWPQTKEQLEFFELYMAAAQHIHEYTGILPYQFTMQKMRAHKKAVRTTDGLDWEELFVLSFNKTIDTAILTPSRLIHLGLSQGQRDALANNLPEPVKTAADVPPFLRSKPEFWQATLRALQTALGGIRDLTNDVRNRIIKPAILLEFENQGLRVANDDKITALEYAIERQLWSHTSLSDKMEKSSYWHSPRVAIGRRFKSVSVQDERFKEWHNILEEPLKLSNGVTAYPLTSSAALQEEADIMDHCVWSYSDKCMGENYHIFSLRDADGQRLSTLSLSDEFAISAQGEQTRRLRLRQNFALSNTEAPAEAKEAQQLLIDLFNSGSIAPDWDKINAHRREYKAHALQNSIGYDFRDPETAEKVFRIYRPCFPRGHGANLQELTEKLGIGATIRHFVENTEFSDSDIIYLRANRIPATTNLECR